VRLCGVVRVAGSNASVHLCAWLVRMRVNMLEGVARSPASLKKFEAMGDGCTTTTSMPELRSSAATDVANSVKNDLVDAYSEDRGFGTNPATRTAGVSNLSIARTQHCLYVKEMHARKGRAKV
jgi:hypothetical protein